MLHPMAINLPRPSWDKLMYLLYSDVVEELKKLKTHHECISEAFKVLYKIYILIKY